jgi:hypothetical protein
MFDFRHLLDPLHDSEPPAPFVEAHHKALPQYARIGFVAALQVVKLWRIRVYKVGHCPPYALNSEQLSVPPHHS